MARNKHGNRKVRAFGFTFDSGAEYAYYQTLTMLEKSGAIHALQVHPRYILQEAFKHPLTGERVRDIRYTADFVYVQDGVTVVVDVKGHATEAYKIRKKLFMKRYPHIRFEEVSARDVR